MPDDFTIRTATVADVAIIVHHRRAMFTDMGLDDCAALDAMDATFEPYLRCALDDGTYRGWLVQTAGGAVVAGGGLLVYEWPGNPHDARSRRAYILNVYTEPEYRRRGLARRIMHLIVEQCRAEGFGWVSLHASQVGRSLYEEMGFRPTNEMRLAL